MKVWDDFNDHRCPKCGCIGHISHRDAVGLWMEGTVWTCSNCRQTSLNGELISVEHERYKREKKKISDMKSVASE